MICTVSYLQATQLEVQKLASQFKGARVTAPNMVRNNYMIMLLALYILLVHVYADFVWYKNSQIK